MNNERKNKINDLINNSLIKALESGENILVKTPKRIDILNGYVQGAYNYYTGRKYSGINKAILPSGFYVSFKQAQKLGGKVKKQAKGYRIMVVHEHPKVIVMHETEDGKKVERILNRNEYDKLPDLKPKIEREFTAISYGFTYVFSIDDCENLPKKEWKVIETLPEPVIPTDKLEPVGEAVVIYNTQVRDNPIKLQPNSKIGCSSYSPTEDKVYMKPFKQYANSNDYYSNIFHELAHATGHASRLNRQGIVNGDGFGGDKYSEEELIAETTSLYIMQTIGLLTNGQLEASKQYLKGWYERLKEKPEGDSSLLIRVFSQADKATNYLLGAM